MLLICLDDSGTHKDSEFVVVGGVIGRSGQWDEFLERWNEKLKHPLEGKPSLKSFSLFDCTHAMNNFKGYNRAESDLLTREFRNIIKETNIIGYASAIDKRAWDELVTEEHRRNMSTAEIFCLTSCVREMLRDANEFFPGQKRAEIIYDAGRDTHIPYDMEKFDWGRNIDAPRIVAYEYEAVADFPPLQAADMIATESYWWIKAQKDDRPMRAHFVDYVREADGRGLFMSRDWIKEELSFRNPDGTVKADYPIDRE